LLPSQPFIKLHELPLQHPLPVMSVAFEPRNFIHDGAYPPIGDEHDHAPEPRYSDNDVAELSHYTADPILPDERAVLEEENRILGDDASVQDPTRLDLSTANFPSPIQVPLPPPSIPDHLSDTKDVSPGAASPPSRIKSIPKPERDVQKQADGKFHCPLKDCKEDIRTFARKCEWK
jgi:hypothetical protein